MKLSISNIVSTFTIVFLSISGCSIPGNNSGENVLLMEIFTQPEIQEINKIIGFVDSIVLSGNKYSDIDKAYHYFLDSLNSQFQTKGRYSNFIDEKQKYDFLFSLDPKLFHEFWYFWTPMHVSTKDTIIDYPENYISLEFYDKGKYVDYVNKLGVNDPYFRELSGSIQEMRDISPVIISHFYINHDKFIDFNDYNYRLWASVIFLSTEDANTYKLQRYFNNEYQQYEKYLPEPVIIDTLLSGYKVLLKLPYGKLHRQFSYNCKIKVENTNPENIVVQTPKPGRILQFGQNKWFSVVLPSDIEDVEFLPVHIQIVKEGENIDLGQVKLPMSK